MKEIRDIIAAYDDACKSGKQAALATVVQVEGSSYRREGARMLITEDGRLTGAISGGCLEGDALRKALLVMAQQKPMLVTYDTTDEDDAKLGLGLGCNGVIHILIEPVTSHTENNPLLLLKEAVRKRATSVLVTLFSFDKTIAQPGTCLLVNEHAALYPWLSEADLLQSIIADAKETLQAGASAIKTYGAYTSLLSLIKPALSLLIFGAGNDAVPLTEMAHTLGWETAVTDGRPAYVTAARFPKAHRLLVARPEAALGHLMTDAQTAVILMTHNYNYDLAMLRQLLPVTELPYLGVLGPKKKLHRMLDELAVDGFTYTQAQLSRVYGPAGLDIGASTPEEIALSILAEAQAVMAKKSGNALRDRAQPIHA